MRRWLATTFALTAILFGVLIALVSSGDVFGLYGTRIVRRDFGPLEMRLTTSGDRVIKALEFLGKRRPLDIVLVGSSRTAFGFDPHTQVFAGLNVYNAGLNGSQSDESADVVRYIAAHGPKVRRIVWSIDFEEFFRGSENIPEFYQSAFGGAAPARGRIMHLLSYEALRKTVSSFLGGQAFYVDTDGFYHYALQSPGALATGDGLYRVPSIRGWFPLYMIYPRDVYETQARDRLQRIAGAIRFARGRGIAVDVVLPPLHVSRRAMYDLLGVGRRFGDWKKALWGAVEQAAAGEGAPVRAFDFTRVGPVALQPFVRGGPLQRSPYFFEVLHFRPSVGDMIAARLLGRPWPAAAPPFGEPLGDTVAEGRLVEDEAAVASWERDNPEIVATISDVIGAVRTLVRRK